MRPTSDDPVQKGSAISFRSTSAMFPRRSLPPLPGRVAPASAGVELGRNPAREERRDRRGRDGFHSLNRRAASPPTDLQHPHISSGDALSSPLWGGVGGGGGAGSSGAAPSAPPPPLTPPRKEEG